MPLVLVCPSTGRGPEEMLDVTALHEAGGRHLTVVIEGYRDRLNVGKDAQPDPKGTDDVAYTLAVIRQVASMYPVDERRIYATGHSRGARFTALLASELAPAIAAIGPVGGLRYPIPNHARHAVSVIAFHGLEDPINPYDGGGASYWGTSVPDAVDKWLGFNGCNASAVESPDDLPPKVHLRAWHECEDDAEVLEYTVDDGGHTWPGSAEDLGESEGNAMPEPKATPTMLDFFEAHPLPESLAEEARHLIGTC